MNPRLFILPLLAITLALPSKKTQAQPTFVSTTPAGFKAPEADLEKWAVRLKKLCPLEGWTVNANSAANEVVVQLESDPVQNRKTPRFVIYRLRLRFSPKLNIINYEALEEENRRALAEFERLESKVKLLSKSVRADGEVDLDKAEREATLDELKRLKLYRLPQFYSPDYSLALYRAWPTLDMIRAKEGVDGRDSIIKESKEVEAAIVSSFGKYSPRTVTNPTPDYYNLFELPVN